MNAKGLFMARSVCAYCLAGILATQVIADTPPPTTASPTPVTDSRVRTLIYSPDAIYRLRGFIGYDIEIEFAPGESFTGLGGGDLDGLVYGGHANYFTVKPRAQDVRTNLLILTNKRRYLFDYVVSTGRPDPQADDVVYLLRFAYPPEPPEMPGDNPANRIESALAQASHHPRNFDYWYCGNPAIKPESVSDDGVHTRLQFAARAELPAIFVRNDDGSESLLNFSMDDGDIIIHRVTRRLILRRGRLTGCVVNKAFDGGGKWLQSGTLSPEVRRDTQAPRP
jgi:type IV secretion system protein VirB9